MRGWPPPPPCCASTNGTRPPICWNRVLARDTSPATTQAALPTLRAVASATRAADDLGVLARALARVDPAGAEELVRGALTQAASDSEFRLASTFAGHLINLLRDRGGLREALDLAGQMAEYTRRAGLGPWTQLADQGSSAAYPGADGRAPAGTHPVRSAPRRDGLPFPVLQAPTSPSHRGTSGKPSFISPVPRRRPSANGSKTSTSTAPFSLAGGPARPRHPRDRPHPVQRHRAADPARAARRSRTDPDSLQQVYEDLGDLAVLAKVLSAPGGPRRRTRRHNRRTGAHADRDPVQLRPARIEIDIAGSHVNLATYLGKAGSDPAAQRAHRLAAVLIFQLTGMAQDLADTTRALAGDLRRDTGGQRLQAPSMRSSPSPSRPKACTSAS